MHSYSYAPRWLRAATLLAAGLAVAPHVRAQMPTEPPPPAPADDHSQHAGHDLAAGLFSTREASGTAWQPDLTPMYGVHRATGTWQWMFHGNAFGQYVAESGKRGNEQAGSINWTMAMVRRTVGPGRFGLRAMFSLEPWTISGCGYPDLLASGEVCDGETIRDRQHPHDLVMELAAEYEGPLAGSVRWQVYAGAAGEPALGPVAYPHRLSAMPNPIAPVAHHWLDATHITFGVVNGALFSRRWKAEASVFNGREPDEHRGDLDLAPLDSYSGRLWVAPTSSLTLQVSAGHLTDAEAGHGDEPAVSLDRATASATYHRQFGTGNLWATTAAWGRNAEAGDASQAVLFETNMTVTERHTVFGRFEVGRKEADELGIHGLGDAFTLGKVQAGYTRYLSAWRGLKPGFGAGISVGIVPQSLAVVYGRRMNTGFAVFITVRPAVHQM
jgi:hypothetical protein